MKVGCSSTQPRLPRQEDSALPTPSSRTDEQPSQQPATTPRQKHCFWMKEQWIAAFELKSSSKILCLVFSYGFTLLFIYVSESTPWCCFESPSIHILPVLKTSVFAAVYLCDCNMLSFSANIHIVVRFKSAFTCLFYFFLTYNVERFLCFVVAVCVVISSINAAIPCAIYKMKVLQLSAHSTLARNLGGSSNAAQVSLGQAWLREKRGRYKNNICRLSLQYAYCAGCNVLELALK